MEAALAEFKAEELGQDAEEDVDFVMEVGLYTLDFVHEYFIDYHADEQDAFGSDFESTDEEGAQEDVDATAEKMVREQDAPSRKVSQSQLLTLHQNSPLLAGRSYAIREGHCRGACAPESYLPSRSHHRGQS